jgi:hypothetical protein
MSTPFRFSVIEATSIGRTAYSRLKTGGEGTVQGVFDAAINIFFSGGLVSLVPEVVQRGPLNITLKLPPELPRMSSFGVRAGDKVEVQGFTLELGDRYLITFGLAGLYSPKHKFAQPMLADNEIEANLEVMRETALQFGNMSGLGELLALMSPGGSRAAAVKLNIFASFGLRRIVLLEKAFQSEEKNAIADAVSELIGLGPGLTPSSDDMLAGLALLCVLYAKNRGRVQRASRLIAQATASEARGKTTLLSEEYLSQAASGRGNEPVMRLCAALLTGRRESVELETRRVLKLGESSGTDTVLGIVLGTMLCTDKQSSLDQKESE